MTTDGFDLEKEVRRMMTGNSCMRMLSSGFKVVKMHKDGRNKTEIYYMLLIEGGKRARLVRKILAAHQDDLGMTHCFEPENN